MKPALKALTVVPLIAIAAGCASKYYKVTDTSTGKPYYTQEVSKNATAVQFKDAKTGAATTLQSSQVLEIEKGAYSSGLAATSAPVAPAPAVVTPVAAPAAPAAAAQIAPAAPPATGATQVAPSGQVAQ
jgi:hypothetical protein